MNKKIFGVSILIIKDDKILAIHRRDDPNDWGLIGDHVDENETPEEAAIRECHEETGLILTNPKLVFARNCGEDLAQTFTGDWEGIPTSQKGEPSIEWMDPYDLIKCKTFGEYNIHLFQHLELLIDPQKVFDIKGETANDNKNKEEGNIGR